MSDIRSVFARTVCSAEYSFSCIKLTRRNTHLIYTLSLPGGPFGLIVGVGLILICAATLVMPIFHQHDVRNGRGVAKNQTREVALIL